MNNSADTQSYSEGFLIYDNVIISISLIGDLLTIIGLVKCHLKLYPIEVCCFFLTCIIQFVNGILKLVKINKNDSFTIEFCYLYAFREIGFLVFMALLLIISFNRVYILKMSLISNKNVKDKRLRGIKRYKRSAILIGILIILFFLMDLPRLVSQDIFKIVNENTCDFRHNWIYKLFINFIFIILINIILAINYLIVVPYYVIKFKRSKKSSNNKQIRNLIKLSIKLCFYTFYIIMNWTFDAFYWVFTYKPNGVYYYDSFNFKSYVDIKLYCVHLIAYFFYSTETFLLIILNKILFKSIASLFCKLNGSN